MKVFDKSQAENLWYCCGDFGQMQGVFSRDTCTLKGDGYELSQELRKNADGVYTRRDTFRNTSEKNITLHCLKSRFVLEGGDYEVYTQYNGWMNESRGKWQSLVTQVAVGSPSVRTALSANPFVALWNNQTNRGIAFHLLPESTWEMRVSCNPIPGGKSYIQVEMGIDAPNLALKMAPGEKIELPEIIYYEFTSRLDMDCYKLHRYCTDNYRKRSVPVMYDTWLYKFDKLSLENTLSQIPLAAELGAEYFVIDAGWFGKKTHWASGIGDWVESLTFGYKGNMIEVAESVRKHGMKFGLWLETERAVDGSDVLDHYKKYYLPSHDDSYFLNYADEEARNYIFDVTCGVVDKYGVEYIKFDFNSDLFYDASNTAFTEYFKGYNIYIKRLRQRYPNLYIDNCASGGMRMHLANCKEFDSFWHSDCQGAHEGMRLFKDAVLRLPPQVFDRWTVIESVKNVLVNAGGEPHNHIISTSDAVWQQIEGVQMSHLKGFLSGGPLGFSCDLSALSKLHFEELKKHIAQFKQERDFWTTAECRITVDTESLFILEFRNRDLSKVVTQIYIRHVMQKGMFLYPQLDPAKTYRIDGGETVKGSTLMEEGYYKPFTHFSNMTMEQVTYTAAE